MRLLYEVMINSDRDVNERLCSVVMKKLMRERL